MVAHLMIPFLVTTETKLLVMETIFFTVMMVMTIFLEMREMILYMAEMEMTF